MNLDYRVRLSKERKKKGRKEGNKIEIRMEQGAVLMPVASVGTQALHLPMPALWFGSHSISVG